MTAIPQGGRVRNKRRPKGSGTLTERAPGVWRLRAFAGTDPVTKKPRQIPRTVHGSRKEAQAELNRLLEEVAQGRHDTAAGSVGHLLGEYIRHLRSRGRAEGTLEGYERHMRLRILPAIGKVPVRKLTARQLDELYDRALEAGLDPATIAQMHALMSGALTQAVKWDLVPFSVAPKATPPIVVEKEARAASVADLAILGNAAYRGLPAETPRSLTGGGRRRHVRALLEPDPDLGAAILLYALTGCRRGELCGLRWSDLERDTGILHIRRQRVREGGKMVTKPPKGGKVRWISIGDQGLMLFEAHRVRMQERAAQAGQEWTEEYWVLSPDGGFTPMNPNGLGTAITDLARRVGLGGIHTHSFRHFSAGELTAAGFDPRTIGDRHGHSKVSMTLDQYTHRMPQRDLDAANYLGSLLPVIDVPSRDAKRPAVPAGEPTGTAGELTA